MTLSHFQREHLAAHPGVANRPARAGGNAFIDAVYARLSPVYDVIFGTPLQPGRIAAVRQMAISPGDRVLEVGAGTGINAPLYPQDCHVTAIDLSAPMLNRARRRVARQGFAHVELLEQDAARMSFRNDSFDSVYAPYVMSVVVDPIRVAREMRRVCRPGGRIVILNHFRSTNPLLSRLERATLVASFDLAHFGRAPARFDEAELDRLNAAIVHQLPFEHVAARLPEEMGARAWEAIRPKKK